MKRPRVSIIAHLSLLFAILVSGLGLNISVPTATAQSQGRLHGESVVRFQNARSQPFITDLQVELAQGKRDENGVCHFSIEFHAVGDDTDPQIARMSAVDPASCAVEVERGRPAFVPGDEVNSLSADEETTTVTNPGDETGGEIGIQSHYDKQVKFSSYWEDPLNLDVNKVSSSVRTHTFNTTVTSADCRNRRSWLGASGWEQLSSYYLFLCESTSGSGRTYVEAAFQNTEFCFPNTTFAYYFGNVAYATPYATSGYINDTFVQGGCTRLLSGPYYIFEPGVYY